MEKILGTNPGLSEYILQHGVTESGYAKELREQTKMQESGRMISSAEQVQLVTLLAKLIGAKRVAEVGVFTGYSTLRMAEALADDAQIYACDITDEWMKVGQPFWQAAGVENKIIPKIAPAAETLESFILEGKSNTFDLIYIDADKVNNLTYYKQAYQLVRSGGLIIVDNVLWSGQVTDPEDDTEDTVAIREANEFIHQDERVEKVLLPVGDGVTIALKY